VTELGVAESVELGGPIPRTEIPALLVASHALVNNMRPGAPDKVVYEAAAACRPVIVSNPVFDELLDDLQPPLRFALDDVEDLAARITAVGSLDSEARGAIGAVLRERVLARHSVDSWADAVVRLSTGSPSAER
jgi:glycosyltransferase involved in cell wall biosynthesis